MSFTEKKDVLNVIALRLLRNDTFGHDQMYASVKEKVDYPTFAYLVNVGVTLGLWINVGSDLRIGRSLRNIKAQAEGSL